MIALLRGRPLFCFRLTKIGQPEHPLYQRGDAELVALTDTKASP